MEHDSAIRGKKKKKKENLATCMNTDSLEGIMLSEINQTEKDKYGLISAICGVLTKFIETESRMVVDRD